jgi:PGF-CTERM protein
VTATVRNDGDSEATKSVSLAINETTRLGKSVTLGSGASETVTFSYEITEADVGEDRSVSVSTPDASVTRGVDITYPPIAAAIEIEQQPVANGEGVFDGSNSVGQNLTYMWTFDDGEPTDPGIAQPYTEAGTSDVTLVVEDEFGRTAETTRSVTVESGSTDNEVPGFGSLVTLVAVLVSALLLGRRSD